MSVLNFILPPEKDKQTDKGEGAASRVPISSETALAIVRLGDLLKTFFVVGLLSLWVGEQNSGRSISPTRLAWWPYVLVSIFVFVAYLLIAAKKVHSPIWRWLFGILFLGLVWFPYVISWYPPPASFLTVLAGILLVLAFILFLVLLLALVLKKRAVWNKLDRPFRHFVTWGNDVSWPLSLVALLASVLLGWARLKESNVHGWWMDPLLYMGILISFVVSLEAVRGRRT